MLIWFNRYQKRKAERSYDAMYEKNEAQLERERVSLAYEVLRSFAK